jgi:hypothetical protein
MATTRQHLWAAGALECHERLEPAKPTRFEIVVRQLRLENDPQCWAISNSLRLWAKKHKNQYYIPEELLASWDMHVVMDD